MKTLTAIAALALLGACGELVEDVEMCEKYSGTLDNGTKLYWSAACDTPADAPDYGLAKDVIDRLEAADPVITEAN